MPCDKLSSSSMRRSVIFFRSVLRLMPRIWAAQIWCHRSFCVNSISGRSILDLAIRLSTSTPSVRRKCLRACRMISSSDVARPQSRGRRFFLQLNPRNRIGPEESTAARISVFQLADVARPSMLFEQFLRVGRRNLNTHLAVDFIDEITDQEHIPLRSRSAGRSGP